MPAQRGAGALRGRRDGERLHEAAFVVGEGDLVHADVLEGAARQLAVRAPALLLAIHLAHELAHERLAHLIQYHNIHIYTIKHTHLIK